MKHFKLLVSIFLFCSISVNSQNIFEDITFSKNMKRIEKGEFSKAFSKIEKALSKNDDELRNNYAISLIYTNQEFDQYSTKNAYNYLLKSEKEFHLIIDEKTLEKLNKTPINDSIYLINFKNICNRALEDALVINKIDHYNDYIQFYYKSSLENKNIAIKKRDIVAFNTAVITHTIESYKYFINNYPQAEQINEAWSQVFNIAFDEATSVNTIKQYKDFISSYPKAPQIPLATEKIHIIAFDNAKSLNTSFAYKNFFETYPNSNQYNESFNLYESTQFLENTKNEDWVSYQKFINNYYSNSKIDQAKDSILTLGIRYRNIDALESYINNYYNKREYALEYLYPLFTKDGEESTINLFINKYGQVESLFDQINKDLSISSESSLLLLNLPFDKSKEDEYKEFIRKSSPSEIAFVTLQRLISYNINKKRWNSALLIMDEFDSLFNNNQNFINLRNILNSSWDKSIYSKSIGSKINRSSGEEYGAVISADNKYLYFCGKNKSSNIGGEDIFMSKNRSGSWRTPRIIDDLSTVNYNEATVNISTDGTTLILFKEGKLLSSDKTNTGWSSPEKLPYSINSGKWNSDATISSDGSALIFASVRENSKNLFSENENHYHGDNQYPSDLFVSLKDKNDNWGIPFNIGDSLNTRYTERSPFLHPDMKTLYFSSDGHGGMGKLDVFMTTRLYDSCWTCWSEPINLGKEINTIESDWGYKISTDGKTAYFTKETTNYKKNSLLLLLDISGSMRGEKLRSLKEAAKDVCENAINNNSKVSIMAFEGECNSPIDTMLDFTNNIQDVDSFINTLYTQGGTPMYNAYILASKHIYKNAERNSNKMIILMTDGDATDCGKTLDESLRAIRHNKNKVQTQTIAFMVDSFSKAFNDLHEISDYTGGELFYVENSSNLKSSFSKATNSLYGMGTNSNKKDIYTVTLPVHLRPDLVATVEGKLLDSDSIPINATIRFEDLETNKLIGKIKNNPEDGSYFIVLPLGKLYGLYVDKDEYFPISGNIDLRNEKQIIKIENNIPLYTFKEMIEKGIAVPINNIFFDSGLSELKDYSIPELKRISKIIIENNLTVELSGHTDNIDTEEFNLTLSEDRSNAVKEFLVNYGCDENKIITIGYGESNPLNNNSNSSERKNNRRVEFRFIK